jgi:hypothetical protein
MPSQLPPTPDAYPRPQPFTLYAAHGRIYASNVDQKLIDLGAISRNDQGFCWLLDGNQERGDGHLTEEAALRDLSRRISFLFLDGQFTANADVRDTDISLDGAARLDVTLDELAPGERMENAGV